MATLMKATACVLVAGTNAGIIEPESNLLWNEFETPRLLNEEMVQEDMVQEDDDDQGLVAKLTKGFPPGGFGAASLAALVLFIHMFGRRIQHGNLKTAAAGGDPVFDWKKLFTVPGKDLLKIVGFGAVWALVYVLLKAFVPVQIPLLFGGISLVIAAAVMLMGVKFSSSGVNFSDVDWKHMDPTESDQNALIHFLAYFAIGGLIEGAGRYFMGSDEEKPKDDDPAESEDEQDDEE